MEVIKLSDVAAACNGKISKDTEINGVCIDTRKITPGCLFICIKGERFDAHEFALEAIEKGAAAVMVHKKVETNAPYVLVKDTSESLLKLSAWYRSQFSIPVIGLTGSVGKTTTKEFTYLAVSAKYNTIKTLGNLNNEIGLPQMLFTIDKSTQAAVIEMGMNHFGEIHRLSKAARPNVGIITNIGVSHIENLGSREGILKAKLEMLDGMEDGAPLIVNSDDELLSGVKLNNRMIITFGINSGDFRAVDISEENTSTSFSIDYFWKSQRVTIPTVGIHNVYNALAAFTVAYGLDVDAELAAQALSSYVPEGMRQKAVQIGGIVSIEDCYNASPDSMRAALTTLKNMKASRKIAVLSDMLELGDYAKEAHLEIGRLAAECGIDFLLCTGPLSENYIKGAQAHGSIEAIHFSSKEELAEKLVEISQANDAVLFKASRGMKLEDVIHFVYDRWENK